MLKNIQYTLKNNYIGSFFKKLCHHRAIEGQGNKLRNYRLFKLNYQKEIYVDLLPPTLMSSFARFRLRSHNFNIESQRFKGSTWIAPHDMLCNLCDMAEPQDEFHIIMNCLKFHSERKLLFTKLQSFSDFSIFCIS